MGLARFQYRYHGVVRYYSYKYYTYVVLVKHLYKNPYEYC